MEWAVLDWNRPAIRFYKRLGAASEQGVDPHPVHRRAAPRLRARSRAEAREASASAVGGILSAQGAAASNAAAARSTAASWRRRPTICRPTGSPLRVKPHGTEIAGRPVSVMP